MHYERNERRAWWNVVGQYLYDNLNLIVFISRLRETFRENKFSQWSDWFHACKKRIWFVKSVICKRSNEEQTSSIHSFLPFSTKALTEKDFWRFRDTSLSLLLPGHFQKFSKTVVESSYLSSSCYLACCCRVLLLFTFSMYL